MFSYQQVGLPVLEHEFSNFLQNCQGNEEGGLTSDLGRRVLLMVYENLRNAQGHHIAQASVETLRVYAYMIHNGNGLVSRKLEVDGWDETRCRSTVTSFKHILDQQQAGVQLGAVPQGPQQAVGLLPAANQQVGGFPPQVAPVQAAGVQPGAFPQGIPQAVGPLPAANQQAGGLPLQVAYGQAGQPAPGIQAVSQMAAPLQQAQNGQMGQPAHVIAAAAVQRVQNGQVGQMGQPVPGVCRTTVGSFKDATPNGPLIDGDWKCRACGKFVPEHEETSAISANVPAVQRVTHPGSRREEDPRVAVRVSQAPECLKLCLLGLSEQNKLSVFLSEYVELRFFRPLDDLAPRAQEQIYSVGDLTIRSEGKNRRESQKEIASEMDLWLCWFNKCAVESILCPEKGLSSSMFLPTMLRWIRRYDWRSTLVYIQLFGRKNNGKKVYISEEDLSVFQRAFVDHNIPTGGSKERGSEGRTTYKRRRLVPPPRKGGLGPKDKQLCFEKKSCIDFQLGVCDHGDTHTYRRRSDGNESTLLHKCCRCGEDHAVKDHQGYRES